MKTIANQKLKIGNTAGFTLIELLVVISIIGVLAAFTIPVFKALGRQQKLKVARVEIEQVAAALDNYKAKYGAYPPGNNADPLLSQLYYELSGTEPKAGNFVTLDGGSSLPTASVQAAYGVGGFINCSHGGSEDGVQAKNFLPNLKANQYNTYVTNNSIRTSILVTSVGGPDPNYQPLNAPGINPIRYRYPGVNNPNSYDLWVQLVISGQTNLICNWSKQPIINSPLP